MRVNSKRIIKWTTLLLCLLFAVAAMADNSKSRTNPRKAVATNENKDAGEEILKASSAFFAGFPFVQAEPFYQKAVLGNDKSHFLVSVQTADEFSRGHVPDAVNIPLSEITGRKALDLLPKDRKIILTCDNGHRSMAAALFLGQLGYDTGVLSFGLSHWNASVSGIAHPYTGSAGYPVSTEPVEATASNDLPVLETAEKNVLVRRANAVFSSKRGLFIDHSEVYEKAVLGKDNSYFLVSLQRPEDYAKGHVPGAINIPASEFAKKENLRKLPRDKKIVLICYIGHWGAAGAFLLNQLGYEAYDMRFGTMGWNDETEGLGEIREVLLGLGRSLNYPVEGSTTKRKQ